MSKESTTKNRAISFLSQSLGDRFEVVKNVKHKNTPYIMLLDKKYKEAIFGIFILGPDEDLLKNLDIWRPYIENSKEKNYIIVAEKDIDQLRQLVKIMPGNISSGYYKIDGASERITGVVYE